MAKLPLYFKQMLYTKLFKIKAGKQSQWEGWCKTLATVKREEALETLKSENVTRELFLIFPGYTVGIGESEDLKPADPKHPLNQEHKRQKSECLEVFSSGEVGYDLRI